MSALSPSAEALAITEKDDIGDQQQVTHPYCPAVNVVANWHNGNHQGAFATCMEQPCDGVKRVSD